MTGSGATRSYATSDLAQPTQWSEYHARPFASREGRASDHPVTENSERAGYSLAGGVGEDLEIVVPIDISVTADGAGRFVVADDTFLVYGAGATENDALRDYAESLSEYYDLVQSGAVHNRFDEAELRRLLVHLRRRAPFPFSHATSV